MVPLTAIPTGDVEVTATFTGTEAELTGEAQTYTPEGTVETEVTGADAYPVCVLLNDIQPAFLANDVVVDVVYNTRINKAFVEAVHSDLEFTEQFIWACYHNGLDIVELA